MTEMTLKKDGIYKLPDGREFIAGAGYGGVYGLFAPNSWDSLGRPDLRARADGRIYLPGGRPTNLCVSDLVDTGIRAARPTRHKRLL